MGPLSWPIRAWSTDKKQKLTSVDWKLKNQILFLGFKIRYGLRKLSPNLDFDEQYWLCLPNPIDPDIETA